MSSSMSNIGHSRAAPVIRTKRSFGLGLGLHPDTTLSSLSAQYPEFSIAPTKATQNLPGAFVLHVKKHETAATASVSSRWSDSESDDEEQEQQTRLWRTRSFGSSSEGLVEDEEAEAEAAIISRAVRMNSAPASPPRCSIFSPSPRTPYSAVDSLFSRATGSPATTYSSIDSGDAPSKHSSPIVRPQSRPHSPEPVYWTPACAPGLNGDEAREKLIASWLTAQISSPSPTVAAAPTSRIPLTRTTTILPPLLFKSRSLRIVDALKSLKRKSRNSSERKPILVIVSPATQMARSNSGISVAVEVAVDVEATLETIVMEPRPAGLKRGRSIEQILLA